jgi:hypothetical protein
MDTDRAVAAVLLLLVAGLVFSTVPFAYPRQKPLPERPADLSAQAVRTYTHDFERAYAWNQRVDSWVNPVTVSIRRTNLTRRETGYRVHLEVGFSERTPTTSSTGYYTVNYLVTDSGTLRAQTGGHHRPGPDPRNGTVVARAS